MIGQVTIGYINELNGARTWGPTTAFAGPVADSVATGGGIGGAWDPVNQKLVVAYRDKNNSNRGTVRVGTVDFVTNTVAWGTPVVFSSAAVVWCSAAYDPVSGQVAISYDANCSNLYHGNSDWNFNDIRHRNDNCNRQSRLYLNCV
jgi:hypothetical protein